MFASFVKKVFATNPGGRVTRPTPPTALTVEALADRIVPSSVEFREQEPNNPSGPHTAIIIGDSGADSFVVNYDGEGGITVTDEGGAVHSHANVNRINITTHGGDDVVRFRLTDTLVRDLVMNVNLNGGHDRFTGTLNGDIAANVDLTAIVSGSAGDDLLTMYGTPTAPARANDSLTDGLAINTGGMRIGSGATLNLSMWGGGDEDRIFADYTGELDGVLQLDLRGEDKQDVVSAIVNLQNGSSGQVGTDARAARVSGGADNDNLTFFIFNPPNGTHLTHRAVIDGGWDLFYWANNDTGHRTNNVTATEVEVDFH
jgi:hypothetical protein